MPTKYKNILKDYKEMFKIVEKQVHNPNLTNHQNIQNTIDAIGNRMRYAEDRNEVDKKETSMTAIAVKAIIDDMNGKLTHYFIKDKGLIDFLKTTEIKDTSIVSQYVFENVTSIKEESSLHLDAGYYTIALHTEEEAYCFTYLQNPKLTIVTAFTSDSHIDFPLGAKVDDPICKLAINLIYYMKAYPEKILTGVPQDMVKNDKKKFTSSKCHSIGIAEEIVEKTEIINGHIVTPHFRSGFFRHYTDDRYVNMKGKVQFIAATMVKGKAKTVVA